MAREDPHFRLRIPEALLAKIQEAASAERRSATAEIVERLERSFDWAKIIKDHEGAEERLFEQAKTERELRRQIELLEEQVAMLRNAEMDVDLTNTFVQDAMIERMRQVMDGVVKDMQEEHRITSGMPLLLAWFDEHPEERAKYDALPEDEQDDFVVEKTNELWIEQINARREATGKRRVAKPKPGRKVRLDK